ncbi:MAG: 6-bladed beta-propeller [Candidatus Bathyarchaeia archaeon]
MAFSLRKLSPVLVFTIISSAFVGVTLVGSPVPPVRACNTCNFLLTWGSPGAGNGQFSIPDGVAVDSSGNVYVADYQNSRVEKFTSTGTYVTAWGCTNAGNGCSSGGSGNGQFSGPWGLAVDSAGNVYVADSGNNRVEKFTGTGTYVTQWGCVSPSASFPACPASSTNGQFNDPNGVAVDSAGNVYVVDTYNNRVEKFTSSGTFILTWGSLGSGKGQFYHPESVGADSSGNVYVTDIGSYIGNRWQIGGSVEKFGDSSSSITSSSTTQLTSTSVSSTNPTSISTSATSANVNPQVFSAANLTTLVFVAIAIAALVALAFVGIFLSFRRRGPRGTATPTYGMPTFCSSCGSPLGEFDRFCDRCGASRS